jgi:hypothetical protein
MENPVMRGKFGSQNKVIKKLASTGKTVNAKIASTGAFLEASLKLKHW